jgi:glycogen(starch) synthase
MHKSLQELGRDEVNNIRWQDAGLKVRGIYESVM